MSDYGEELRRTLRASLVACQMDPGRAAQAVDLACHAAEAAMDRFGDVLKTAPDSGLGMSALQIAAQLVASRATGIFNEVHASAQAKNLPSFAVEVRA